MGQVWERRKSENGSFRLACGAVLDVAGRWVDPWAVVIPCGGPTGTKTCPRLTSPLDCGNPRTPIGTNATSTTHIVSYGTT